MRNPSSSSCVHSLFPPIQHHFIRNLSSTSKKWNSTPNPNLKITNPTLLLIEESCNSISQAKQIHAHMLLTGLISHLFPVSRLLSFLALDEKGDILYANKLFSLIKEPNVYIWNTIIRGYVKNSLFELGFSCFSRMLNESEEIDKRSYVFGLKACKGLGDFRVGESVHSRIWKLGFVGDVIVTNGLIHFYCATGRMASASRVFSESGVKDVISWTSLIDGFVKNDMSDDALKLFDEMRVSGIEPNEVTMVTIFNACARKGDLSTAQRLCEFAESRGIEFSLNMRNAMLDMHVKCGGLVKAGEIFYKMDVKDVFSWTCMIDGHAKSGEVDLAREFFDDMPYRNVVSWNSMIGGYSQNNRPKEALMLFHEMLLGGLKPTESTLVPVLSACAQSGHLETGQWIHEHYLKTKKAELTTILGNAFIDMYAKCGDIIAARKIFDEMGKKDLVSYNSMIVSYASHGHAIEGLSLFEHVIQVGIKPDNIMLCGVLSACAHAGLVEKGWGCFKNMESLGLVPVMEHYACMVDLLGRVGQLKEAYELIKSMPMEPDEGVWGALLNGCRLHGNVELGKFAADRLMKLEPEDSGSYMLLANLCANKKKWGDVMMARSVMREKGIKKTPGCSSIEVEGEFHEFLVADKSHPDSQSIYKVLKEILFFSKSEDFESLYYWIDTCS